MRPLITYHIVTLFPTYFESPLSQGLLAKAIQNKIIDFKLYNLRDYTQLKHGQVDDQSYGGGPGMVLRLEPLVASLKDISCKIPADEPFEAAAFTPIGHKLTQRMVSAYTQKIQSSEIQHLILYCGRYEGFDERFLTHYVQKRIRIGDSIFMGGEVAALVFGESLSRLLPGVVGNPQSLESESFSTQSDEYSQLNQSFDYPVYTRPQNFNGLDVPTILLGGNHEKINQWRLNKAIELAKKFS